MGRLGLRASAAGFWAVQAAEAAPAKVGSLRSCRASARDRRSRSTSRWLAPCAILYATGERARSRGMAERPRTS
jgi:hypothetical protein